MRPRLIDDDILLLPTRLSALVSFQTALISPPLLPPPLVALPVVSLAPDARVVAAAVFFVGGDWGGGDGRADGGHRGPLGGGEVVSKKGIIVLIYSDCIFSHIVS